jgi:ribonuclease Z
MTSEGVRIPNADLTDIPMPHLSYAYCSDTLFMPDLAGLLKGVEVLYHEATFLHDMKDRAVATYHTTAKEAALLAKQSEVRKLLIGHFSARYKQLEPLLEEARSVFSETELALEGQKYRFD